MPGITRDTLKKIAEGSLDAIERGSYSLHKPEGKQNDPVEIFDLRANVEGLKAHTLYYGPNSSISSWAQSMPREARLVPESKIWAVEKSTLEAARWLVNELTTKSNQAPVDGANEERRGRAHAVGVLNFASAKKPGGGFLTGSQAQVSVCTSPSIVFFSKRFATGRIDSSFIDTLSESHMPSRPTVLYVQPFNYEWQERWVLLARHDL